MAFVPEHPQPFSLEVAVQLSIPEITGEIDRLQLSIQHLESTQQQLLQYLTGSDADNVDLLEAFKENKATIASQNERIFMLRIALERKGATVAANPHYATIPSRAPAAVAARTEATGANNADMADGGLYL